MPKQKDIDAHNRRVIQSIIKDEDIGKQTTIESKRLLHDDNLKVGTKEIRNAYFKQWYAACKDIYNKDRRKKRREKKDGSKGNATNRN